MSFYEIASIAIRERQRAVDSDIVSQLKESIASKGGLIHAPVVATDDKGLFLVVGEHRLLAMTALHAEKRPFYYSGALVPPGHIPATHISDLTPADLLETELEENVIRAPMPWQDKARVLSEIHKLRQAENPTHTMTDTARELAAKSGAKATGSVSSQRDSVRNAVLLAQNLHRPSVAKARNATEALGILLKEENAKIEAELINRKKQKATADAPSIQVIHGSLLDFIPTIERESVDLIIADLPYGIGTDTGGFRNRTVEHHNYDDSAETAQTLMQAVIADGFAATKPRANLFIFGDVDLFPFFKVACAKMGWKPFRTPIIWRKSESEGLAPWGREGFRRTYEMIFFATKGQRGLIQSPVDILDEKRVGRSVRRYGPEKPVGLLEQLIECSTLPGDLVLDPCCGSGSTLAACRRLKRKAIGIELDEGAYNLAVVAAERDEAPAEPSTTSIQELA